MKKNIAIDSDIVVNAREMEPQDEDWDVDMDANGRYTSGPGKHFQDQKTFGTSDRPKLKITNIPAGCESQAVRQECEACGDIDSFTFVAGRGVDARAHAYVQFKVSQH